MLGMPAALIQAKLRNSLPPRPEADGIVHQVGAGAFDHVDKGQLVAQRERLQAEHGGQGFAPMAPALMPESSTSTAQRVPETKPIPAISEEPGMDVSASSVSVR